MRTDESPFLDAVHASLGGAWWPAREAFFAVEDESLWPCNTAIALGRWLAEREGQWVGDLILERKERSNWSAVWRVRTLDEALADGSGVP